MRQAAKAEHVGAKTVEGWITWIDDRESAAGQGLVVVGDEGAFDRCTYLPVVPDRGVEREQALDVGGPQPSRDAPAVAFQAELVLQRPDNRLDPLAQLVREVPLGVHSQVDLNRLIRRRPKDA